MVDEGISIVICTHNGSKRIGKVLESFVGIRPTFLWEVLVVDNNSSDCLILELAKYKEKVPLVYLNERKLGLANARWKGIKEANFEYILFCDDDNVIDLNYLTRGFEILKSNPKIGVLAGVGTPVFESIKPEWFDDFQNTFAVGTLGRNDGIQRDGFKVYGAGLFMRREPLVILRKRGFVNSLIGRKGKQMSSGEDVELTMSVMNLGYEYWFNSNMIFFHLIDTRRLIWSDYVKWKISIANSFPILEAYKVKEYKNVYSLNLALFKKLYKVFKSIFWICLNFNQLSDKSIEVSYYVNRTYFTSFFVNYISTIKIYRNLKRNVFFSSK